MGSHGGELSRDNAELDRNGLTLWCRNGQGAGAMLAQPQTWGRWAVRMRIDEGTTDPTTKVCLLLWPQRGDPWPPELDFNESGRRYRSNQTLHLAPDNRMIHRTYEVDQAAWHTYAVDVRPGKIRFLCDGKVRAKIESAEVPEQPWNLHVRTTTEGRVDVTRLQVRWVRIEP